MDLKSFAKQAIRRRRAEGGRAEKGAKDERNSSVSSGLPLQAAKKDAKETDYEDGREKYRPEPAESQQPPN
ncbi:MAG: hypothetical protein ABFE07_28050 [Armatimonadia bacterium]